MADKLSVSDSVTKVYQAARDGSSDLTDLLKGLKTEQRKTAWKQKLKMAARLPLLLSSLLAMDT